MLIIDKGNKERYYDVLENIKLNILKGEVQSRLNKIAEVKNAEPVNLSKMRYVPTGLLPDPMQMECERIADLAVSNFQKALCELSFYGSDPKFWRIYLTISSNEYDWGFHSLSYWHYKGIEVDSAGIPNNEKMWEQFMIGALVYHTSDNSWGVHT